MKSIRQLLRQPIKTASGIILVTLAVAILCICMGQAIAADQTAQAMDYQFSTVALPTSKYQIILNEDHMISVQKQMPQEILDWVDQLAAQHPNIIKQISRPGLASAYIPQLTPDNFAEHPYRFFLSDGTPEHSVYSRLEGVPAGAPYSCAILEVTLTEVSALSEDQQGFLKEDIPRNFQTTQDIEEYLENYEKAEKVYATKGYSVELTATVDSVVALQEGYRDPTGMTIRMTLEMSDSAAWDELDLSVGDRCLVYGMDYFDEDWALHYSLYDHSEWGQDFVWVDDIDMDDVVYMTDAQLAERKFTKPGSNAVAYYRVPGQGITVYLNETQIAQIDAVSLTLDDPCYPLTYEAIRDEEGVLQEVICTSEWSHVDESGQTVSLTMEEYYDRYQIPTIVKLEAGQSAADFPASPEGAPWQTALDRTAINNQSFPVIGVDKLGYLADFARETARVTQGRDFTQQELDEGALVCILSESLAQANGLSVGDVVTPRFYAADESLPYQAPLSEANGIIKPTSAFYFDTTDWAGEAQEYTIIGLYRQDAPWSNTLENPYAFTPNTIFVPKNSVQAPMQTGDQLLFLTVALHNGKMNDFMQLVSSSEYSELFVCYDQGYSTISTGLHDYQEIVKLAAMVGAGVYGVILLLFLFLFPGHQGSNLFTMGSFGATWAQKLQHILLNSFGLLLPGTLLGFAASILLWRSVTASMMNSAGAALQLELDPLILLAVALLQLILALLLTLVLAITMAAKTGLMKKN